MCFIYSSGQRFNLHDVSLRKAYPVSGEAAGSCAATWRTITAASCNAKIASLIPRTRAAPIPGACKWACVKG